MKFLLTEIIKPATHRAGTLVGGYLAAYGYFGADQIATIETASTLVAGFLVDLIVRKAL